MTQSQFAYIVIGGGTAGAVVAARLAEQSGERVALFEAGPNDEGQERVLQLRNWPNLLETDLDFDYPIEPQPRGNSLIRHARGRVLGGCSSHNSSIAFLIPDYDLQIWAEMGVEGWSSAEVAPFNQRLLEKVHLETPPPVNQLGMEMIAAANQFGFPTLDFSREQVRPGVGWFQLNKKGPIRQSSSVAYLHPLSQWGERLTIFTNSYISRILFDAQCQAIGVQTPHGPVYAEREIILACGAFDTPKLLMLSGLGPADHLIHFRLPVLADLPGVGENLLDHPESVIYWQANRDVPQETTQFWEIGLFACLEDPHGWPDLMYHFGPQPFDMQTVRYGFPTNPRAFSLTPNIARARSQGVVRLRSADAAAPPLIDFRYFTDPDGYDDRILREGIKLARRFIQESDLRHWVERELAPGPAFQTDEEISAYARQVSNTVYHPAGTCRMGDPADPLTVVDSHLRVKGVTGLRIADASVFPTMIGVNPALTVFMIGERCADFLLNR